jgi:hypothetical protein
MVHWGWVTLDLDGDRSKYNTGWVTRKSSGPWWPRVPSTACFWPRTAACTRAGTVAMGDWGWAIRADICKLHPPSWTYLTPDTLLIQCVFVCCSFFCCCVWSLQVSGKSDSSFSHQVPPCQCGRSAQRDSRYQWCVVHVWEREPRPLGARHRGKLQRAHGRRHAATGKELLFVRDCCLSGTAVCQGLLFVRDCCLSGTAVCQGLLFVRGCCCLSRTAVCQGLRYGAMD